MMKLHKMISMFAAVGVVQGLWNTDVNMTIETPGYPSNFYLNSPVKVTCSATASNSVLALRMRNIYDDYYISCEGPPTYLSLGKDKCLNTRDGRNQLPGAHVECHSSTVEVTMPVFTNTEGDALTCILIPNNPEDWTESYVSVSQSDTVKVTNIYKAPENLRIFILDDESKVIEGKPFTFQCESEADPKSIYRYEILRENKVVAVGKSYMPGREDRGGFTIRCTDQVHEALIDVLPDSVTKSQHLQPSYLSTDGDTHRTLGLNLAVDHTLTCDVIGYPDEISYTWSCDKCGFVDHRQLYIPRRPRNVGDAERITCNASIGSTISYVIYWKVFWIDDEFDTVHTSTISSVEMMLIILIIVNCLSLILAAQSLRARKKTTDSRPEAAALMGDTDEMIDVLVDPSSAEIASISPASEEGEYNIYDSVKHLQPPDLDYEACVNA